MKPVNYIKNNTSLMSRRQPSLIKTALVLTMVSWLSACTEGTNSSQSTNSEENAVITIIASNANPAIEEQKLAPYLTREVTDDIFYFVMPDRFNNGDQSNDLGSTVHAVSHGGFNPKDKKAYHGGDMKGLAEKLPYLKDLGMSAIWMTPILRNQAVQGDVSGYHGYWVLDFTEIDPHLGSNADLKNLIDQAHQLNIKVFFDIITNHTADVIKYQECHGADGLGWTQGDQGCPYISLAEKKAGKQYTTLFAKGTEQIKFPSWLNDMSLYHNQGDTSFEGENSIYGDFAGLDDLNTDDPQVVNGMIDIFKNIISEFKPDGFRIDTVKHVNIEFWQQFSPAITQHAQSLGIEKFFMFGEVYSFSPTELSYFTTIGKLPSVLDFAMQGTIADVVINGASPQKFNALFSQDHLYNDEDSNAKQLVTFTGNHDMGRFGYFLNQKHPNMADIEKQKRITLAHAMLYFMRGIPVIYYGDEQGFTGDGNDADSRQDMMPSQVVSFNDDVLIGSDKTTSDANFDQQHPLYLSLKQLSQYYQALPALRQGNQNVLFADTKPGIFAISRQLTEQNEQVIVVFNTSNENTTASFQTNAEKITAVYSEFDATLTNKTMTVTLPPLSFALFNVN